MRVAIIGSREIGNFTAAHMLPHIPHEAHELVSGGAMGIDALAEQAAKQLRLPIKIFYPDYDANGRLAPLIRNSQIVDYADLVLAFWDNHSRGTAHTLNRCIETGKPFRIISIRTNL